MITKQEIWAVAHHVLQGRGETDGRIFIAARIGELALRGDAAGISAWKLIAARFSLLIKSTKSEAFPQASRSSWC